MAMTDWIRRIRQFLSPKRQIKVLRIIVGYGREDCLQAINQIESRFPGLVHPMFTKTIVVDNAICDFTRSTFCRGYSLIDGDNSCWEFSGWDKGASAAKGCDTSSLKNNSGFVIDAMDPRTVTCCGCKKKQEVRTQCCD